MSTVPGSTTLTRTRCPTSSCRSDSENAATPNLVSAYTLAPGRATRPAVELMVTGSATGAVNFPPNGPVGEGGMRDVQLPLDVKGDHPVPLFRECAQGHRRAFGGSRRAVAAPMPLLAPVTSATVFSSGAVPCLAPRG